APEAALTHVASGHCHPNLKTQPTNGDRERTQFTPSTPPFFNNTAATEIYTLSLHDALPILAGFRCEPGGSPPGSGCCRIQQAPEDRKSTRLNSSHVKISYAVFCLKKKTDRCPRYAARPSLGDIDEVASGPFSTAVTQASQTT